MCDVYGKGRGCTPTLSHEGTKRRIQPLSCARDVGGSELEIQVELLMPGQTLLHELLHEWIGIELLYVIYTWTAP